MGLLRDQERRLCSLFDNHIHVQTLKLKQMATKTIVPK